MGNDRRSSRPSAGAAGRLRWGSPKKPNAFTAGPDCRIIDMSDDATEQRADLGLEPDFWKGLDEICAREGRSLSALLSIIGERCGRGTLSASVRVFVISYFRAATPDTAGLLSARDDGEVSYPLRVAFGAVGMTAD
jgi:predicted DNA-binding ribbon-helix-helix protein